MPNVHHHYLHLSQGFIFFSVAMLKPLYFGLAVVMYVVALLSVMTRPLIFDDGARIPWIRKLSMAVGDVIAVALVGLVIWAISLSLR